MCVKVCYKCSVEKRLDDFHPSPSTKDKRMKMCKDCHRCSKTSVKDRQRSFENQRLIKSYGISIERYEEMEKAQNGLCAICKSPRKEGIRFNIDHNHDTGQVRGLLCSGCNRGLGSFKDRPDLIKKAADYLISNDNLFRSNKLLINALKLLNYGLKVRQLKKNADAEAGYVNGYAAYQASYVAANANAVEDKQKTIEEQWIYYDNLLNLDKYAEEML